MIKMACSMHVKKRKACRVNVGKPKRKRPQGRHRSWWEDNIDVDLI
jgi:hypothetical protein